ncbi:GTPase activating factor [Coemansia javaensis]|uniref:GTPase activating factor n=1 Tax=Coemansia javaensis TaxID=2761396 RepID=A0A9W8HEP0_9FUNG|nr:GTPase activating factor [Coemansia javaensis]
MACRANGDAGVPAAGDADAPVAGDTPVEVLGTGVLHLRVLGSGDLLAPAPHALVLDGEWQPYVGVLARCAGHVSLFLLDSDGQAASEVAEVDVGALLAQDVRIVDNSLFGGCFGFSIDLRAAAAPERCGAPFRGRTTTFASLPGGGGGSGGGGGGDDGSVPDMDARRRSRSASHTCGLGAGGGSLAPGLEGAAGRTPPVLYLATALAGERNHWVGLLRRHARAFHHTAAAAPRGIAGPLEFRIERCLWVRVLAAQGLAQPCSATVMVVADGNLLAQTDAAPSAPALRWENASFCFGGLGPIRHGLFLLVRQADAHGGLLGYSQIPLATLRRGRPYVGWYPISYGDPSAVAAGLGVHLPLAPGIRPARKRSPSAAAGDATPPPERPSMPFRSGDVHVQVRYDETVVLCRAAYRDVATLLLDKDPTLVFRLAELMPASADWLIDTVTKIAIAYDCADSWLGALVAHELGSRKERDPALLFRGTSVATRAMDTLMKVFGLSFVDRLVGDVVRYVVANDCACEVDPTRIRDGSSIEVHWHALLQLLDALWRGIETGAANCPPMMRRVFYGIRSVTSVAFGQAALQRTRYLCVSGFVFLRLLCPAMLSPKAFGLVNTTPSPQALRTLTLLAKGIQCVANLTGSAGKEPHMKPMDAFVQPCIPKLKVLIDAVAKPPEVAEDPEECVLVDGNHELAVLCAFVHTSRDQIRDALVAKCCAQTPVFSLPSSPTDSLPPPPPPLPSSSSSSSSSSSHAHSLLQGIGIALPGSQTPRHMSETHAGARIPATRARADARTAPSSPSGPAAVPKQPSSSDALRAHHAVAPLEHLAYSTVELLIHECACIRACVHACLQSLPPQDPEMPPCPHDLS